MKESDESILKSLELLIKSTAKRKLTFKGNCVYSVAIFARHAFVVCGTIKSKKKTRFFYKNTDNLTNLPNVYKIPCF